MKIPGGELVTAFLVLRGEDVVVNGVVSAAGDVVVTGWQRRGGGSPITWTPTAQERVDVEMGLWEAWGWQWWEDETA